MQKGQLALLFVFFLAACGSPSKELEARLEAAREELRLARSYRGAVYAPDALRLAESSFRTAERELRRFRASSHPSPEWTPCELKVQRAVQTARLAAWVAERNLAVAQQEAQGLVWAASSRIEGARQSAGRMRLPIEIHSKLRRAELAALQASYLLRRSEFEAASARAREAHELAGGARGESEGLVARFSSEKEIETWRRWVEDAVLQSRRSGRPVLVVNKRAHQAVLYVSGKPSRRFDVDLGYGSLHQKVSAGDGATPEGRYRVLKKKGRGQTIYHRAFLLDYPNSDDLSRFKSAKAQGHLEKESRVGGLIEIHGDGGRQKDWTEGCVALSNADLDYLFGRFPVGSPVIIVGSCGASVGDRCP